ncbi:hypothetical protein RB620_04545 [Paenibacillus sp. LHD-117]|uniref:hypothetical protein n=1 Tax=Paenibacillus sp. LHD-117 TaxID=3071412 RepID=UPI0027E04B88|nr:hypothetical protein [Paenibacillus sp. LHD-117]MDQ6418702.1 hypothetical protein [Paenibacillus sp. LHD-117]
MDKPNDLNGSLNTDWSSEVAASSEYSLPISLHRQQDLLRITNEIWRHLTSHHDCNAIEIQLIAASIRAYVSIINKT